MSVVLDCMSREQFEEESGWFLRDGEDKIACEIIDIIILGNTYDEKLIKNLD